MAFQNLPLLDQPGFIRQAAPAIGRPVTLAGLDKIAATVRHWYRTQGRPFVDVTVPPQNITSGVVQVVVTEYRVGQVTVAGNRWFPGALLRRESGLAPGQTLNLPGIQTDLDWLNQNPFRHVDAAFQPGTEPGLTNVILQTRDRLPFRAYAGYDNQGVPSLGRNEWNVGFTWGNAFGLDQLLSYQFTRAFSGRFTGHALTWSIPLPWRDTVEVFGSYEQETPSVASGFDESGQSGQASLRYIHPLPGPSWLRQQIAFGYDYKTTNNNLAFGGVTVFASQAEVDQFPFIYSATETDPLGRTGFDNHFVVSPGGMTGANTDAAAAEIVPGAAAHYVYDRFGLTRTTLLPKGFTSVSRIVVQLSDHNLLDSEQLAAGGLGSVPGYATDTALGSEGEMIGEEIRLPFFRPARLLHLPLPLVDQAQFGVFWDYADLYQVHSIPDLPSRVDLASTGIELRYDVGRYASLDFAVGWQLRAAPGIDKRGAFGDFSITFGP